MLTKFVIPLSAKWCKRFHLTWIMSLHYLVILLLRTCYHELLQKLQNLSHLNRNLQIRQIWIQLTTACGKYCKKMCKKNMHHWSRAINDFNDEWLLQSRHDAAWLDFSVAVSVPPDQWCVFCTPFAIVSIRCNQLDSNLANLGTKVEVG